MQPEQQQRILGYFLEEAKEHLATIENGLLNLQGTLEDQEMINEVFRAAHSIKGGSAMLGLTSIQHTAHRLEDCFKILKDHPVKVDRKLEDLFLKVSDTLKALIEYLSSNFGLPGDKADALMAGTEPVIKELNEHLLKLVEASGHTAELDTEKIPTIPTISIPVPSPVPSPVTISQSQNKSEFQSQVLQILREMLQLFKQVNIPESREKLQRCCHQLSELGKAENLANWCNLCESAANAISNPDNTYITLAKIIITEIKQAEELLIQNREAEITVSSQLKSLIVLPELELLEFDTVDDGDVALPEISIDDNSDSLFTDNELISADIFELTSAIPEQVNISNHHNGFTDSDVEILANNIVHKGPEVGISELNTLADLFEGESPELEESWQQEEIIDNNYQLESNETESNDFDLTDLLELDQENAPEINNNTEDLSLLFDSLRDEERVLDNSLEIDSNEQIEATTSEAEAANLDLIFPSDDVLVELIAISQESRQNAEITAEPVVNEASLEDLLGLETKLEDVTNELLPIIPEESNNSDVNALFLEDVQPTIEEITPIKVTSRGAEEQRSRGENSHSVPDSSSQSSMSDLDDLFALPEIADNADNAEIDLDSFWNEMGGTQQFSSPTTQEVSQELESSLFSGADSLIDTNTEIDIFSDNLLVSNDANNVSLDDFDLMFQEEPRSAVKTEAIDNSLFADFGDFGNVNDSLVEVKNGEVDHPAVNLVENVVNNVLDVLENPEETSELDISSLDVFGEVDDNLSGLESRLNVEVDESLSAVESLPQELETLALDTSELDISSLDVFTELSETLTTVEPELTVAESVPDEFAALGDLLNDSSVEPELTVAESVPDEFAALGDLLNDSSVEPELTVAESVPDEFAALGDLLNDANESSVETPVEEPILDEFVAIEALLEAAPVSMNQKASIPEEDFAALEALLGDNELELTPAKVEKTQHSALSTLHAAIDSSLESSINAEFEELENFLKQTDKTISSQTATSNTSNKNVASKIPRTTTRRVAREEMMKIPVKQLDDMSNLVGELVVNRNSLEQDYERLRQSLDNLLIQVQHLSDVGVRMQEYYERSLLESSLLASRRHRDQGYNTPHQDRGFSAIEMDRFTPFHSLAQEMIEFIVRVRESASDIDFVVEETEQVARQLRQATNQLQEGLTKARMVPFTQAIDLLRRGVRDNPIKYGKQVELVTEGADTLIDKMILDHLKDPLTHMVNNAIAHGIETPEVRQSRGKSPVGKITIRALQQGNQTIISVSDDGAGIDHERVKQKAIKKGVITVEQGKTMSRSDIYELLFLPSFSTADEVDDIKGRGVGMNVVQNNINEIRGTVSTDSVLGQGTTFTIRLPLTLSICKALFCTSDRARIAFPMDGIEDTLDIPANSVKKNADGELFIKWRDTMLPFKPLKEILVFNRQISRNSVYGGIRDDDMICVIVVRSGNNMVALQIDQILSEQEIVIKQFEGPVPKPSGVAGATVLGDGMIMPIADVLEIIDIFHGKMSQHIGGTSWQQNVMPPVSDTVEKAETTVLVVDDSITVRELLSLTFSKAGYRVEQARNGKEAWDKLRSGLPCDLMFCDIEMPLWDGLELLSHLHNDDTLNNLPVAMLTSRAAEKHRQMAVQYGAKGYFIKPYLEEALLEAASRMLRGEGGLGVISEIAKNA